MGLKRCENDGLHVTACNIWTDKSVLFHTLYIPEKYKYWITSIVYFKMQYVLYNFNLKN